MTSLTYRRCEGWGEPWTTTEFERLFLEKTKNAWANRKTFEKKAGGFNLVDIDYGGNNDEEDGDGGAASGSGGLSGPSQPPAARSTLHPAIQDLIRIIFDVDALKKVTRATRLQGLCGGQGILTLLLVCMTAADHAGDGDRPGQDASRYGEQKRTGAGRLDSHSFVAHIERVVGSFSSVCACVLVITATRQDLAAPDDGSVHGAHGVAGPDQGHVRVDAHPRTRR